MFDEQNIICAVVKEKRKKRTRRWARINRRLTRLLYLFLRRFPVNSEMNNTASVACTSAICLLRDQQEDIAVLEMILFIFNTDNGATFSILFALLCFGGGGRSHLILPDIEVVVFL